MTATKKGRKRKTSELDTLQLNIFDMPMALEAVQEELNTPAEQVSFVRIVHTDSSSEPTITLEELVPLTPAGKNYRIKPEDLSYFGGSKVKFVSNLEAIKCLKKIENEKRTATEEEQSVLVRYVGWGGLADAFNEKSNSWTKEYTHLKDLLTNEEYEAARKSTLNAHYTADFIIKGMYQALSNMGFEKGNILEPSLGVGHFFGLLPAEMCTSKLYGVELDSLTGRMAQQLYPKASIQICGFEDMNYPDNFFDVAIGNIPFGDYKVYDKAYEKQKFLIHDYFLAKMTDKVRPGGVVAVITSKGTMDKVNTSVREYLAQKVELLGAIRLPNTAFKSNAGTEVTSDILFLKKLDTLSATIPNWVNTAEDEQGILMNQYFIEHPEMILGEMKMVSGPYGMESTCKPYPNSNLEEELYAAVSLIKGEISKLELLDDENLVDEGDIIPADINVKNYSYTLVDDEVYFRENANMFRVKGAVKRIERIKGMIQLRDCIIKLLNMQLTDCSDEDLYEQRAELNKLYDIYIAKYGILNSKGNKMAFGKDDSYFLLASIENLDELGNLKSKADIFNKRTISKSVVVTSVETASEALVVSLREQGCVDLEYMAQLSSKSIETIKDELIGVIFENPATGEMETAEEYLSGNVRKKLDVARVYAAEDPKYLFNVEALEKVQPEDLTAAEIEVKLGATWIDTKYINQFMVEVFNTPDELIKSKTLFVQYSRVGDIWNIEGKSVDNGNVFVTKTFGTKRVNAYKLLEDTLNLKDIRIFDTIEESDGTTKRVLNKDETTLAMQKQEDIKNAFKEWIFNDVDRREILCRIYNDKFNAIRPRQYDGSHLNFAGMTPDITLQQHQKDAIALILHGGNALLAHEVGLGKTFEMVAGAMESKRLGLCQKSLFVVPNHLTEQIGADFLRLYPSAKILISTKKDFETKNRKKFCSRIATGDYDAVIIGHTQFEKIPLSAERQSMMIHMEIDEIIDAIDEAKEEDGSNFTIKQMEAKRNQLQVKLERLLNESKKDNVITFEQLGVDRLFVDEAHSFKNLYLHTKMRNVGGIAQTDAQKSSDMFYKCRYIDELTNGTGIIFATGTPVSNSMTELYTMMRYLQYDLLCSTGLKHFDSWASTFGETITAIELAPEGTGYRAKTRFARFFNLPELLSLFKQSADIKTSDMVNLVRPDVEFHTITSEATEFQKDTVLDFGARAERVRNSAVDSSVDNMLKITNDGRKLALDQRLVDPDADDYEESKVNKCVNNAYKIWKESSDFKGTQLIFCDLSTPKNNGLFNVYFDIREKLIKKGVPAEEIAFIHDANTDARKADLFANVRSGKVRFLLGSTSKMGAGTNVQTKLIALHHIDVPWRPSDILQREGRIIRQGNENKLVHVYKYVTKGTFDSYSWQIIENKQRFIGQIMTSKTPVRSCEDIDEAALSYAEIKALSTGNPYIKEKMDLDIQVSKLRLLKANHRNEIFSLQDLVNKKYPSEITNLNLAIKDMKEDLESYKNASLEAEDFSIIVKDVTFDNAKDAMKELKAEVIKTLPGQTRIVGEYLGFKIIVKYDAFDKKYVFALKNKRTYKIFGSLGITRMTNALEEISQHISTYKERLAKIETSLENAKVAILKTFDKEEELQTKSARLAELNILLNMDKNQSEVACGGSDDESEIA